MCKRGAVPFRITAMNITVEPGDANPAADALNGVYEKYFTLKPGHKVLDLGAHAGYFTRVAWNKIGPSGHIVAFEPHPGNFSRLVRNCSEFAHCVQAAAWDKYGVINLWPSIDNSGGHSVVHVGAGQEDKPIEVATVDIGEWLLERQFKPDFVKIDTELSEVHILTSIMEMPFRPAIAAEVHNLEMWEGCRELLRRRGYTMTPDAFTNYYLYAWQ